MLVLADILQFCYSTLMLEMEVHVYLGAPYSFLYKVFYYLSKKMLEVEVHLYLCVYIRTNIHYDFTKN